MHHALAALAPAATAPTPVPTVDPDLVTPGPWGFAIIVLLTLAVILLVWDMMRRIRRGRVRADIREELAAEAAEAADAALPDGPSGAAPEPGSADGEEPRG